MKLPLFTRDINTATQQFVNGIDFNTPDDLVLLESILNQDHIRQLVDQGVKVGVDYHEDVGAIAFAHQTLDGDACVFFNSWQLRREREIIVNEEEFNHEIGQILAHECAHVKQMREGRLYVNSMVKVVFEGVEYVPSTDYNSMEYMYQPWEREANLAAIHYLMAQGVVDTEAEGWQMMENRMRGVVQEVA